MKICKNGYEGHVLYGLMQNKLIQYFLGKISISLVDFTESVELLNKYAYDINQERSYHTFDCMKM